MSDIRHEFLGPAEFQAPFPEMKPLANPQDLSVLHASSTPVCEAATFASLPALNGTQITFVDAAPVANTTSGSDGDLCLVTVRWTHPGESDNATAWVALPLRTEDWSGRFVAVGGGGWLAGSEDRALAGVWLESGGFAAVSTDGGHSGDHRDWPGDWGLLPTVDGADDDDGADDSGSGDEDDLSVNLPALEDFASRALVEAVLLGKKVTETYYGTAPRYSYWNGCSTGGRQGHVMAQRIPEEFDGIMAGAPAINWAKFLIQEAWGYVKATDYGIAPPPCVFDAFTSAAIDACDELDGVKDGVITLPGRCAYDPSSLVGETIDCSALGGSIIVTQDMADLVQAIWTGPTTAEGKSLWYGMNKGAPLASTGDDDLLVSNCTSVDNCTLSLFSISESWVEVFLRRHREQPAVFSLPLDQYETVYNQSVAEYAALLSTDNPDLTRLAAHGTKMIVWHGEADTLIATNGSVDYYERVAVATNMSASMDDFYRLFLAPGVGHCGGGPGLDPSAGVFGELVRWVEDGDAPDRLAALGPAVGPGNATALRDVGLCRYPGVLTFTGTDPNDEASFECL